MGGGLAKYQQLRFAVVLVATRALLLLIQLHPRPGTFPLYVHYIHLHLVSIGGSENEKYSAIKRHSSLRLRETFLLCGIFILKHRNTCPRSSIFTCFFASPFQCILIA